VSSVALYAFDGTSNEDRGVDEHGNDLDSNVLDFFRGYSDPRRNDDPDKTVGSLYLKGIGTRAQTFLGERIAEAFGIGGHKRIRQAVARLENNCEEGDLDIDVVGFSRGAAIAVSFANTVAHRFPQLRIRFLGLWDVVGQFGLPGRHVNAGHDLRYPSNVDFCCHAMALDETRALFPLTRLSEHGVPMADGLREVWFRGVHSDVGGGNGNPGLNWISLNWMYAGARRAGLPITQKAVEANVKDGLDADGRPRPQQISDHKLDVGHRRGFFAHDILHASVQLVPGTGDRPHNNPAIPLAVIDDEGVITPASGV